MKTITISELISNANDWERFIENTEPDMVKFSDMIHDASFKGDLRLTSPEQRRLTMLAALVSRQRDIIA